MTKYYVSLVICSPYVLDDDSSRQVKHVTF